MEISHDSLARAGEEVCSAQKRRHLPLSLVVNPVVERLGDVQVEWFEGCLSCPGYVGLVPRHEMVLLTGFAPDGTSLRVELEGWAARIAQHELDHLEGRLYIDRIDPRTFITRESYVENWRMTPISEFKGAFGIPHD
jgi:peptide deformylase